MAGLCFLLAPATTFSLNIDEDAVKRGHECLKYFLVFSIFIAVASVVSYSCHVPHGFSLKSFLRVSCPPFKVLGSSGDRAAVCVGELLCLTSPFL